MGWGRRIIDVRATVDVDARDEGLWVAQVPAGDELLGGLFAWGASFSEAREALAELVVVALSNRPGRLPDAVRVFATSRKVFAVSALQERAVR